MYLEEGKERSEVTRMAFRVLFLAHATDADPEKHKCIIETGKYKLYSLVVRNQSQAVEECKKLVAEESIHSIILCPGFTHKSVAEIVEVTRIWKLNILPNVIRNHPFSNRTQSCFSGRSEVVGFYHP